MGIRGIGERGTDNAHYTYDGTNWQATVPLWWDTLGDKANLYAWLPANEQNQPDDNHLLLWNIPTDQSEGYAAGDLLISHNVSNLPTGEPAALRFGHVLSSVTLELLPGIGFTADDLPRATLLLNGYPTQVTADIRTATLSKAGAPADITPGKRRRHFPGFAGALHQDRGRTDGYRQSGRRNLSLPGKSGRFQLPERQAPHLAPDAQQDRSGDERKRISLGGRKRRGFHHTVTINL